MKNNASIAPDFHQVPRNPEVIMQVRVRSMELPPIKDGLVIGKKAAIGTEAMLRTLSVLTPEEFQRLPIEDDVIEGIIARTAIVKKVSPDRLVKFVLSNLKPLMVATELLMLDVEVEVLIEDTP